MANEIAHDHDLSAILYAIRFQLNGDVFLTNGASDEVWGTGGRDADDYDVTMTETTVGESGHYVGNFDTSANIAAGVYTVTVYLRAGASPANSDRPLGKGVMYWDGSAELNQFTLNTQIEDDVIGGDEDTLESLSDQMDVLSSQGSRVLNKYPTRSQPDV